MNGFPEDRARALRKSRSLRLRLPNIDELTYTPGEWDAHLRLIKAHYKGTLMEQLLEYKIKAPCIDRMLALRLLEDDCRNQRGRPALPKTSQAHYRCWHLNAWDDRTKAVFNSIPLHLVRVPVGEPYDRSRAHRAVVKWHNATTGWRKENPYNRRAFADLVTKLRELSNDASFVATWKGQPVHYQTHTFDVLNMELFDFLCVYLSDGPMKPWGPYHRLCEHAQIGDGMAVLGCIHGEEALRLQLTRGLVEEAKSDPVDDADPNDAEEDESSDSATSADGVKVSAIKGARFKITMINDS